MEKDEIKKVVEMALLCAGGALNIAALKKLFSPAAEVGGGDIRAAIDDLRTEWERRALEIKQSAGGFQFATRAEYADYLPRLANEKPPRLSRRLLEVLAVIAYRQPATRGDIERIRGVATSPQHLRFLEECGWIEAVGRRETPGRPMMFATTAGFLDDLGLKSLEELPPPDELEAIDVSQEEREKDDKAEEKNRRLENGVDETGDGQTAAAESQTGEDESQANAAGDSQNGEAQAGESQTGNGDPQTGGDDSQTGGGDSQP